MEKFLNPESVALIGVTRQSGPGSWNNLEIMLRYGFKGRVYAVHPKASEICGYKTYPAITEVPEIPDLVVISMGRDHVLPVFQKCAQKGVKNIIIISQGFADADDEGRKIQDELIRIARENDIRILGPNTLGTLNAFSGFSTSFVDIQKDLSPPPLSLVAQTGLLEVAYESFTGSLGKSIDLGNCSDLDFVDALNYLETDPQTQLIVVHMEGLKRGRLFLETAARVSRKKPILIFKTGRSSEGATAAISHTGSMVGEDSVFEKAFEKAGIIRANNMIELLAASRSLLKFQPMKGPRVGIITATGAGGIITLDALKDYGLESVTLPEDLTRQLESPSVAWHKLHNPLDIWSLGMVAGSFTEVFKNAARLLLQEQKVDAVLGICPALSSPLHSDVNMAFCLEQIQEYNPWQKPIAIFAYGDKGSQLKLEIKDVANVLSFSSIDEAVMGLAATWRYSQILNRVVGEEALDAAPGAAQGRRPVEPPSKKLLLGEESFELLRHYHIPIVPGGVVKDLDSAVSLSESTGYPVALKIVSPQWIHKSDLGGVMLNIKNRQALQNAFKVLQDRFSMQTPQGVFSGILIQKYIQGTELLFGIKQDPQFGPLILAGFGGIYTEIFKDISRELAPVSTSEAEKMLKTLRCYPLLAGYRGQAGADKAQLTKIILSLSQLAMAYPEIEELDLNPVLVNDSGAWCVDSRIVFG